LPRCATWATFLEGMEPKATSIVEIPASAYNVEPPKFQYPTPWPYWLTNPFVYFLGALMILSSGALWVPSRRMPKKKMELLP